MKRNRNGVRTLPGRRAVFILLIAALLGPTAVQAACMDKLTCSFNYLYNDTQKQTLKSAKIDFHPNIATAVTTRVACNEVGDGTDNMTCSSIVMYAYIYIVKTDGTKTIANPGWSDQDNFCEKMCNLMGVAAYYMNGGPL